MEEALKIGRWVFAKGAESQREAMARLAGEGLRYFHEELTYNRERRRGEDDVNVPKLRLLAGRLAVAMAGAGYDEHPVVVRWLKGIVEDPLPEVRRLRAGTVSGNGG